MLRSMDVVEDRRWLASGNVEPLWDQEALKSRIAGASTLHGSRNTPAIQYSKIKSQKATRERPGSGLGAESELRGKLSELRVLQYCTASRRR